MPGFDAPGFDGQGRVEQGFDDPGFDGQGRVEHGFDDPGFDDSGFDGMGTDYPGRSFPVVEPRSLARWTERPTHCGGRDLLPSLTVRFL
ncbi:hypothetical protein [Streptomyces sp. NPDC054952]